MDLLEVSNSGSESALKMFINTPHGNEVDMRYKYVLQCMMIPECDSKDDEDEIRRLYTSNHYSIGLSRSEFPKLGPATFQVERRASAREKFTSFPS